MWKNTDVDKISIVFFGFSCYNFFMDLENYLSLIDGEYKEKFSAFKEILLNHNKICNLTSITDEKGVLYKHFLDSLAGEKFFPHNSEVIEIGSGGGFPSIPLKIIREDLKFTLVESTGKKCSYLEGVVDKLGLNCVQVKNIRAEEGAHDKFLREKFDIVCARAVARLNTLSEYCLPFIKVGGRFIAYKGDAAEEIKEAENAVKILGGEIEDIVTYSLPEDEGKRTLVVIRKINPTPLKYPRGQGKERKQPL